MTQALIVIGSTASGKTGVAHSLFTELHKQGIESELVNLDAFQFYKGVDIGTAKPDALDQIKYRYHLLNILEPNESIDAQLYANKAREICGNIVAQKKIPICVGGSGLYLRAFLHGLDILPSKNDMVRSFLRESAVLWGWPALHKWLQVIDKKRASEVHANDGVRIERALEIFFLTQTPPSIYLAKSEELQKQECLINAFVIQVNAQDSELQMRIKMRTLSMLNNGWIHEVQSLQKQFTDNIGELPCMRAIGYLQIYEYLNHNVNNYTENQLAEKISTLTWQYAKRQRTWNAKEVCDLSIDTTNSTEITDILPKIIAWWESC